MGKRLVILGRVLPAGMAIACLGFGLSMVPACDGTAPGGGSGLAGRETEMVRSTAKADRTIPPIDAAAPVKTETASFALG
jgi:hypothetical protein